MNVSRFRSKTKEFFLFKGENIALLFFKQEFLEILNKSVVFYTLILININRRKQ